MADNATGLRGKVAIITGSSTGIGAAIAEHFAREGCCLTLTARNVDNLNEVKQKCMESGLTEEKVLVVKADLMVEKEISAILDATISTFGKLDILVNNAGIIVKADLDNMTMTDYHGQMQVNVHSVVHLTQLAVPHLEKTKGAIINISSAAGMIFPYPPAIAYSVCKAALDQFSKCCALDLAPRGIRVNSVCPATIDTQIQTRSHTTPEQFRTYKDESQRKHALLRIGLVDEVAAVVTFFASGKARQTTGSLVGVTGGRHCLTFRADPSND